MEQSPTYLIWVHVIAQCLVFTQGPCFAYVPQSHEVVTLMLTLLTKIRNTARSQQSHRCPHAPAPGFVLAWMLNKARGCVTAPLRTSTPPLLSFRLPSFKNVLAEVENSAPTIPRGTPNVWFLGQK